MTTQTALPQLDLRLYDLMSRGWIITTEYRPRADGSIMIRITLSNSKNSFNMSSSVPRNEPHLVQALSDELVGNVAVLCRGMERRPLSRDVM